MRTGYFTQTAKAFGEYEYFVYIHPLVVRRPLTLDAVTRQPFVP